MRQRKPKNLTEKLESNNALLITTPESAIGYWRLLFDHTDSRIKQEQEGRRFLLPSEAQSPADFKNRFAVSKLFLEIGVGKGKFLLEKALADENSLFLGFEGRDAVLLRALEKTAATGLKNLLFSRLYVLDLKPIFAEGELDGVFLNFSDPWPKERHSRRRLTSPEYLNMYEKVLKPGGFIEFKTDSYDFFTYSKDTVSDNSSFQIDIIDEDLHRTIIHSVKKASALADVGGYIGSIAANKTSVLAEDNGPGLSPPDKARILSEYEERFIRWNRRVYFMKIVRVL